MTVTGSKTAYKNRMRLYSKEKKNSSCLNIPVGQQFTCVHAPNSISRRLDLATWRPAFPSGWFTLERQLFTSYICLWSTNTYLITHEDAQENNPVRAKCCGFRDLDMRERAAT